MGRHLVLPDIFTIIMDSDFFLDPMMTEGFLLFIAFIHGIFLTISSPSTEEDLVRRIMLRAIPHSHFC